MHSHLWFLFNAKDSTYIKELSGDDLKNKLLTIKEDQLRDWCVWKNGWKEWIPLLEKSELIEFRNQELTPPSFPVVAKVTQPSKTPTVAVEEEKQEKISVQNVVAISTTSKLEETQPSTTVVDESAHEIVDYRDRRKHPRADIRLRVIIMSGSKTFRTFTKDVSLGGVSLEHPVPEAFMDNHCQIYMAGLKTSQNIKFKVKLSGRNDLRYFYFSELEDRFVNRLSEWLTDYTEEQRLAEAS